MKKTFFVCVIAVAMASIAATQTSKVEPCSNQLYVASDTTPTYNRHDTMHTNQSYSSKHNTMDSMNQMNQNTMPDTSNMNKPPHK